MKASETEGEDRGNLKGVTVELEGLECLYGKVRALEDFDLLLQSGELMSLLGPSGCGKTTVLRILAGLQDLNRGHVRVGGRDVSGVPANKRDMGMVFQSYSLFPHMTVGQNVEFGLRLRRLDSKVRRRRAMEMLELVSLESFEDRYPHQLSGGQQQRVALARALAIEPAVLLLDEPLSALDAKVRAQLREEIHRVQREVGTTTLFVTHDQEEALAISNRVGVMRDGQLEQVADPETIYTHPQTQFVAEFVGQMNQIPVTVSNGSAVVLGKTLPVVDGSVRDGRGTALVRPENVCIRRDPNGESVVAGSSFLGATSRVDIQAAGGVSVSARTSERFNLRAGDRVTLWVDEEAVLVVGD